MIDLIICVEYTSSMACDLNRVRNMIISTLDPVLSRNPNAIRISVVLFQSHANHNRWLTKIYKLKDINTSRQWLIDGDACGGNEDECEAIGDSMEVAMNIFQLLQTNGGESNKKLVILITDGPPSGLYSLLHKMANDHSDQQTGADPWIVANKFNEQDITLAVVGVSIEPNVLSCDDFYFALARKTGGLYIPLINAKNILSSVIQSVVFTGITFRQAFSHIQIADLEQNSKFKYSIIQQRVDGMLTECQTLDDIKQLFFHR